jgi:hypothetical protein
MQRQSLTKHSPGPVASHQKMRDRGVVQRTFGRSSMGFSLGHGGGTAEEVLAEVHLMRSIVERARRLALALGADDRTRLLSRADKLEQRATSLERQVVRQEAWQPNGQASNPAHGGHDAF